MCPATPGVRSPTLRRASVAAAALLAAGCVHTPGAPTADGPVDVLDYLVGDARYWPRRGSHFQDQFVDSSRQEVCWAKYGNPRTFECWRWDDDFVYHEVDHAIDGNTGESYRFSDGRWLPRRLSGTWTLDVPANLITWFDPQCAVEAARSGVFPYRQRAWIEASREAGIDLGPRPTLVLEYQPYDPAGSAGAVEQFYFARGAGWYEWDRGSHQDMFNRVGGPTTVPVRGIVCGAR